jgi:hippurate hydrolase
VAIRDDAAGLAGELSELRHAIHAEPEIGLDLPKTQARVLAAVDGLPLEITLGKSLSSVTAVLRGGKPGKTVLLRADMDALPITENTGLPFASRIDGAMHACGHDLHTAMLCGAARLLAGRQADLTGNVIFMFQPGEEGPGGAAPMLAEGLLDASGDRPVAAYGLHVTSGLLPAGLWTSREGPLMAAADTIHVTVRGRGGHASRPNHAADPIYPACQMVTALPTLGRRLEVFDPVMLTVGTFHAGTADNVIPDEAKFSATVRTFSAGAREAIRTGVPKLVGGIAAANLVTADVEFVEGYPVTANNPAEFEFARQTLAELFGAARFITTPQPVTGSEDFSFVLDQVPGAFVMLGACPPGSDPATAPFNHSAGAVFDDSVLPDGAALLAELAVRRLAV